MKPLLYVYRVLLTGICLMRTGEIEANLERIEAPSNFTRNEFDNLLLKLRIGPFAG